MKRQENASISIMKIICVSIILILISGIGVMAVNTNLKDVKIILQNGYEMTALTSKATVSEVLEENNIVLEENQKTIPDINEEISSGNTIQITDKTYNEVQIAKISEEGVEASLEELLQNYAPITEKIVVEQVVIPYETITKSGTEADSNTTNKVLKQGKDGLKEVTYKIKYQNDVEIEKTEISSEIIKEPINKIVEVRTRQITSRSSDLRTASTNPATTASTTLAKKVEGITPKVATFNTSAYCPCMSCCGKTNGITSSGAVASQWYTLAAGSAYPIGTVIYIPYFKDKPNGGWFVVQDRGGAISSDRLDIFYNSHSSALQFGRRYLECYVYEF